MNQKKELVKTTNVLGIVPPVKKEFSDFELYENDYTYPSIFLKKIKIWTGKPANTKANFPRCLLGLQFWFVNFFTGEKKDSDYHGCELKGDDISTEELEVQDNDYFNKVNIGYDSYLINHFKITTKRGKFIEFGKIEEENEKKIDLNDDDNMIMLFSGTYNIRGIRSLKIRYISRKDYVYYRIKEFLILRTVFKKDESKKDHFLEKENYDKLSNSMKCIFKTCLFPDTIFSSILKYL
jgi:hypothetical protein